MTLGLPSNIRTLYEKKKKKKDETLKNDVDVDLHYPRPILPNL